jgi:hypothetical protein
MASFVLLAAAVFLGSVDSIESVAASGVSVMSLADVWARLSPGSLSASLEAMGSGPLSSYAMTGANWTLAQPAFAVFLALSLVAWIGGYRKVRAAGRFAA